MTSSVNSRQKHGKTVKATFGEFGRLELSILGTPCGNIKSLSKDLMERLSSYRLAYVDADHKTEEEEKSDFLKAGSELVYTDKISFQRFDSTSSLNRFQRNGLFNEYDLVLINGNHFESAKQIIVIDEKKPLEKKLDKITNVLMILFQSEEETIPDYLVNHIPSVENIPRLPIGETDKIAALVREYVESKRPELFGLVLAGGKSTRMQRDKGLIEYHGMPHREYLYRQLSGFTNKTFLSCREDQADELGNQYDTIVDSISDLGPFGAILSAFRQYPDKAWLVVACDLPFVSESTVSQLVTKRNPSQIATAFYNEKTDFPEPLITIWEPKAYPVLLHFLALGYSCPRKVLINSNIEMINPENPIDLANANNPEEYEEALQLLKNQSPTVGK